MPFGRQSHEFPEPCPGVATMAVWLPRLLPFRESSLSHLSPLASGWGRTSLGRGDGQGGRCALAVWVLVLILTLFEGSRLICDTRSPKATLEA